MQYFFPTIKEKEISEKVKIIVEKEQVQEIIENITPNSNQLSTAANSIEEGIVFQVTEAHYNKEGQLDYQTDRYFEIGTESERLAKAIKYIRVVCQQKLFSTMVMYPDGGDMKNRFEIFLYQKEGTRLQVLNKINRSNLEAFLQNTKQ